MLESILSFLISSKPGLIKAQQRIAVVFHADAGYELDELNSFISKLTFSKKLIISSTLQHGLLPNKAVVKLGEEFDLVVLDAREFFNPDVLGIVSGVLCGGGCLIIMLPTLAQWQLQPGRYINYLKNLLVNQPAVYYFEDNNRSYEIPKFENNHSASSTSTSTTRVLRPYKNLEQQHTVEAIEKTLNESDSSCTVITSGRGRGKSSLLGLLAARLIENNDYKILITAPRLSVAEPLFYHLEQQKEGKKLKAEFQYHSSTVSFIAPDLLIETLPEADVLFIDEAAAIPLSMLSQLLSVYSQIVFSTTTHGYEGTGRGFVLKFYKLLDRLRPGWQELQLHQPIRWRKDDLLEKWIEDVLLLNLKLDLRPDMPSVVDDCQVELLDRKTLIADKPRLLSVFSLLVCAHYRTSPGDFQYLLDSNDVRIYGLIYKGKVIGVIAINQEGGFDAELSTAIFRGERRPQGHLLAQTLCFHAGFEAAASLSYARVMRVAIHPELQQSGLGSYLLQQVIHQETSLGIDVVGSSFSATAELLGFWDKAEMHILRLGFSRDHVTAAHSAIIGVGLTIQGKTMIEAISQAFNRNFHLWLTGPLTNLSAEVSYYIGNKISEYSNELNPQDFIDIESFARFNRNYEPCMPAINRWIQTLNINAACLTAEQEKILQLSLLYKNNWKVIVENMQLTGKAQAIELLRSTLKYLLKIKESGFS